MGKPPKEERRTLPERYGSAAVSGKLRFSSERRTDLDVIAAAGAAGVHQPLGMSLMRLRLANDASCYRPVLADWQQLAVRQAVRERWKGISRPAVRQLARLVLDWHLWNVCPYCQGRKFQVIPGTPILSDEPCERCHADGVTAIEKVVPLEQLRWGKDLAERLAGIEAHARSELMRKTNGDRKRRERRKSDADPLPDDGAAAYNPASAR